MFDRKIRKQRLTMTTGSHNKYYEIEIRKNGDLEELWTHWGRIGNKGKWQKKDAYQHTEDAIWYANDLLVEKQHKGYVLDKNNSSSTKEETTTPDKPVKKQVDKQYARFIALLE